MIKVFRPCRACGKAACIPYRSRIRRGVYCSRRCQGIARTAKAASPESITRRYWSRVEKNGPLIRRELGRCWGWRGATQSGYGAMCVAALGRRHRLEGAHRISWQIHNGEIGDKLVLHKCDNPICSNPEHLFLGLDQDNVNDMMQKGRAVTGERHPLSKLKPVDVLEIRKRVALGETKASLAREFGITDGLLIDIVQRRRWRHLGSDTAFSELSVEIMRHALGVQRTKHGWSRPYRNRSVATEDNRHVWDALVSAGMAELIGHGDGMPGQMQAYSVTELGRRSAFALPAAERERLAGGEPRAR